jgi:hypothetical protein
MSHPERPNDDPLLRLLRAHLERQEQSLDVEPLATRICKSRPERFDPETTPQAQPSQRFRKTWPAWTIGIGSLALAASVLMLLVFTPSAELRAEQAIRQAEEALRLPVERCYLVEVRADGDGLGEEVLPTRTMRVWAAEDKFRVEMTRGNFHWIWGRDPDGTTWLVSNPQRGLRIFPEEQGPALQYACDLFGLRLESLLRTLQEHCHFHEEPRLSRSDPRIVHVTPRPSARQIWLRSAVLELDPETKVIRKLTLKRFNKMNDGTTISTFTLIDTRPIDHARYRLEGNLAEPFLIYDRDFEPNRRREILTRWVGPNVNAWIRSADK